jgi:SAM-dependent methyltransferase
MRAEDFEYLYNLEERFWWFAAMRHITDTIVGPDITRAAASASPIGRSDSEGRKLDLLDAGCGTGYNIEHYEKSGHRVFSFDIAEHAIAGVLRRGFRKVCQASVTQIPYRSQTFDLVFSFDVLEQISVEEGAQAIHEMHRVLKPGGSLFIRVPAFEWMRSSHDEDLATAHRYTRPELVQMMRQAGFEIRLASYANTLLFPVVLLKRSLKRFGVGRGTDVKPLPGGLGWIDPIFRKVLAAETRVLGSGRSFPFGLSVIAYGKK